MSDQSRAQLKLSVTRPKIPPLITQIRHIEVQSDDPAGDVVGAVTYRTLFGIPVGESYIYGSNSPMEYDFGREFAVWSAFLLAEAMLGSLLL